MPVNRMRDDVNAEALAARKATGETFEGVAAVFSGMNYG